MASRRRTTLASVSNASLNSRPSGVPSRSSMVATKPSSATAATKPSRFSISTTGGGGGGRSTLGGQRSSMGRQSLAPTERKSSTGVRRSTAYGNGGGNRSDPRPLMDKTYLNDSLHKMADYLSTHGYEQPINLKTLSRPSGRDFKNIMGFLFRQIDPSYVPSGRFEDDVIPFLKMIRYPFQLSKSSLAAVGAPQTWPKVMGAISWIVDLLLYEEEAIAAEEEQKIRRQEATQEEKDRDEEEGLTDESAANNEFLDYLGEAYSCFLEGDDDAYNALNAEFASAHEAAHARSEERTKELQESMKSLGNQIHELKEGESALPKLEERRRVALSDREKYKSLLEQLQVHKQNLQTKIDARLEEERRLKEALVPVEESNKALRDQISRQEFSAEDVERHAEERRRVKDAMITAKEAKEKARKRRWTAQEEAAKHKESLRETSQLYDTKAKALSLIPSGTTAAKNAGDVNYELKVNEEMPEYEEGILSNDVRGVIRPKLSELKGVVMRNTQDLRQELSNLLVTEDKVEEEIADVETQLEVVHKQVKRREDMYKKEKYMLDQKVAESKRGVEEEERRLASLATPEDLDRLTAEHNASIDDLRLEIQALKQRQDVELRQIEKVLQDALETALDFKEREEKCLAGLKHKCGQYLADIPNGQSSLDAVLAEEEDISCMENADQSLILA